MTKRTLDEWEEEREFFTGRHSQAEWEAGVRYYSLPLSARRMLRAMACLISLIVLRPRRR